MSLNLHPEHLADLKKSGLSEATIKNSGIYSVPPRDISKKMGFSDSRVTSLMAFPYFRNGFERFKPFPEGSYPRKYYQRFETKNHLYIPFSINNGMLADPSKPLHIVEGEKKALKLNQEGILTVGLSGLWNWSKGNKELLDDFNLISLNNRTVKIVPDNDWLKPNKHGYKKNLEKAVKELAYKLIDRGAKVFIKLLPESSEKIGGDDYLLNHTVEEFHSLPEKEILKEETIEEIHLTDLGNATRFAAIHGDKARYCFPQSTWFFWDGRKWQPDDRGKLYEMAQDVIRAILKEASAEVDKDKRMKLENHALKCESDSKIEAMLKASRSKLAILPKEFDRDPWLFNCLNGTINLLDGRLYPHDKDDLISKISPVIYEPEAKCPAWLEHLNKIMAGNQNLIGFLQRWFGYCLTGSIDERCMVIFHGNGANGKTITVETVSYIMGDYAKRTRTETILIKRENQIPNDIADLVGARFVFSSEAEQDKRLAESLVKDLTGGDSLSVRRLYQEYFTFKPQFKIVLSTNHKPIIHGTDQAIWDRIKLVPFAVTIPENERKSIHEMMGMFQDEAPGILAWMVQGCLEWLEKGLQTPEEVKAATRQYRSDMDVLQEFLDDCCGEDESSTVSCKDLYNRFKSWGEIEGLREREIWSKSTLTRRLKERGYIQIRDSERKWKGLFLK